MNFTRHVFGCIIRQFCSIKPCRTLYTPPLWKIHQRLSQCIYTQCACMFVRVQFCTNHCPFLDRCPDFTKSNGQQATIWPVVESRLLQQTLAFRCNKALHQGPECIRGPSFISSPIALGLLSKGRLEATLDWKPPAPAVSLSWCPPAQILYWPQILHCCNKQEGCWKEKPPVSVGYFVWFIRSPKTGADSFWADTQRSRSKFLQLYNRIWDILTWHGTE